MRRGLRRCRTARKGLALMPDGAEELVLMSGGVEELVLMSGGVERTALMLSGATGATLMPGSMKAVSYTHLDVYKRQALLCLTFSSTLAGGMRTLSKD